MSALTVPIDGVSTVFHAADSRVTRSHLCGTDGFGIRWRCCNGAALTLERRFAVPGLAIQPPDVPGFACRICCMAPSGERLHITFAAADGASLRLTLQLNFHGWKEFCIPYERGFLLGHAAPETLYRMQIRAETGGGVSNILFRDLRLWAAVDARFVYPSLCAQVKHLPCHPRRFPAERYEENAPHQKAPVFPCPAYAAENERDAFREITRRYEALCDTLDAPPYAKPLPDAAERAQALVRSMALRIRHGQVIGQPIREIDAYAHAMAAFARAYCTAPSAELLEPYLLLLRHLEEQNIAFNWYHGRGVASSVLRMRKPLAEAGLLAHTIRFLRQAYEFGKVYTVSSHHGIPGKVFEDSDAVATELPSLLVCILLAEDTPEKVRDMRHFLYYLEQVCLGTAPGIASGCKPDGTIFHHGGYIRNYQKVALYTLARVLRLLSGTAFEPSSALYARMRAILETEYAFSCGVYEPFCLAQYAFRPDNASSVSEFADTAIAAQDETLARQYMALARSSSREMATPQYRLFQERGLGPAAAYQGHRTLSYSAAAVHARGGWKLFVRGYSKYVYAREIWSRTSSRYCAFGLFRSFGALELCFPSACDAGVDNGMEIENGFDHTRWNGATAVHIPLTQLAAAPKIVEDEWAEWLYSDEGFAGGLDVSENGIFALRLHGPEKYGLGRFRAAKSYHFWGDCVLCLGSGIENDSDRWETETTLFQEPADHAVCDGSLAADSRGCVYYIYPGQQLCFFTGDTVSRDSCDTRDTFGRRTFALLRHGTCPQNAAYAYLMQIGTTIERFSAQQPWKDIAILRLDEEAHIVRIGRKTHYVFFHQQPALGTDGPVCGVTEPCILYTEALADGRLLLSVCDPDLHLYVGKSAFCSLTGEHEEHSIYGMDWYANESGASRIWVLLRGILHMESSTERSFRVVDASHDRTILECACRHGLTASVTLVSHTMNAGGQGEQA